MGTLLYSEHVICIATYTKDENDLRVMQMTVIDVGSILYYLYLDKYRSRAHPTIQPRAHGRTVGCSR